jgi:hypothetical protein
MGILLAQFRQMAHGSARSFCFEGLIEVKKVCAFSSLGDPSVNVPQTSAEIREICECEMYSEALRQRLLLAEGGGRGTLEGNRRTLSHPPPLTRACYVSLKHLNCFILLFTPTTVLFNRLTESPTPRQPDTLTTPGTSHKNTQTNYR